MRKGLALLATLFAVGLALRLPGLFFNGMYDIDQMILVWGSEVAKRGIGDAFAENYGFLSYLAFGAAADAAHAMPRFWWAPYKAMELAAEIGILAALLDLVPASRRTLAMALYWLNPWFILHGAWQGFWDGPYVLAALLAVVCLRHLRREPAAWFAFGALIATSAMWKPQGLIQLGAPMGLFLILDAIRRRRIEAPLACATGAVATLLASTLFLVAAGASPLAIPNNYLSAAGAMPKLCNDCLNLWHPVTTLLQAALGQPGSTWTLTLPSPVETALHLGAAVVVLGLIALFSWRLSARQTDPERRMPRDRVALAVLAFASLVISSFGTMAHVNHGYAAIVLLVPFAVDSRRLRIPWLALTAIALLGHFTLFGLGRAQVRPDVCKHYVPILNVCDWQWSAGAMTLEIQDHRYARELIREIHLDGSRWREPLAVQARVQNFLSVNVPHQPTLSLLSAAQALCAVAAMLALTRVVGLRPSG